MKSTVVGFNYIFKSQPGIVIHLLNYPFIRNVTFIINYYMYTVRRKTLQGIFTGNLN